jgi:hypothetical protein
MTQWCIEVPCVDGDADRISNLQRESWTCGFFSCSGRSGHVSIHALKIQCAKNWSFIRRKVSFDLHCLFLSKYGNPLLILLERAETEIRFFSMANGMLKMKMDIDRHGPRLMPNNCQYLGPPYFSLPTTLRTPVIPASAFSYCYLFTFPWVGLLAEWEVSVDFKISSF